MTISQPPSDYALMTEEQRREDVLSRFSNGERSEWIIFKMFDYNIITRREARFFLGLPLDYDPQGNLR